MISSVITGKGTENVNITICSPVLHKPTVAQFMISRERTIAGQTGQWMETSIKTSETAYIQQRLTLPKRGCESIFKG